MTIANQNTKSFIDTNMIQFAANFDSDNVFSWIDAVYGRVYIHTAVFDELMYSKPKHVVDDLLRAGNWLLFDQEEHSAIEKDIYDQYFDDVQQAFFRMNESRLEQGLSAKAISNVGEMHTLAACLLIDAGIICSNDFDIRHVIDQEHYTINLDDQSVPVRQDSAADFCYLCDHQNIARRKTIKNFF